MNDQEYCEMIVKGLVENKEAVNVVRTVDEMGVLLSLTVAPGDMGVVIGKEGNTAKAIRTLIRTVGMKAGSRVNLKILEPEGGRVERKPKYGSVDEAVEDFKN